MKPVYALMYALGVALSCSSWSVAQSDTDAKTLADLKAAARAMNLEAPGGPPFHLQAALTVFTPGKTTPEEAGWTDDYGAPDRYRSLVSAGTQADVPPSFMQRYLMRAFLTPGPTDEELANSNATFKAMAVGNAQLRCVVLLPKDSEAAKGIGAAREYCLSPSLPIIRLEELSDGLVITYNGIAQVGNKVYAKQVAVQQPGLTRARLNIASMAADPALDVAGLPLHQTTDTPVRLLPGVVAGKPIVKVQPTYPLQAKMRHASGTVFLSVLIGKDGRIAHMDVISSPDESLTDAAEQAVQQWRYTPYLLNGQPATVETVVLVNFSFGV